MVCSAVDAAWQAVAGGDASGSVGDSAGDGAGGETRRGAGGANRWERRVLPWSWVGPAASTAVRCELTPRDLNEVARDL